MNYETLEKQIKTLTETDIAEVSDFIVYLKLKERFSDFENQNSYKNAIEKWRKDSSELFENEADREFMQHALDNVRADKIEQSLDEADLQATSTNERLTHDEIFSAVRSKIKVAR